MAPLQVSSNKCVLGRQMAYSSWVCSKAEDWKSHWFCFVFFCILYFNTCHYFWTLFIEMLLKFRKEETFLAVFGVDVGDCSTSKCICRGVVGGKRIGGILTPDIGPDHSSIYNSKMEWLWSVDLHVETTFIHAETVQLRWHLFCWKMVNSLDSADL